MTDKPVSILLVEDNPGDRLLIRGMLTEASSVTFDLQYANRLQAAVEYLREKTVEVILLDLGLPDSQGLGTLNRIHAQVPAVPIVVLTGLNDETLGLEMVNKGAQDYLVKGQVDTNSLVRTIRYAIERNKAEERERQLHMQLDLSHRLATVGLMVEGIAHEINNPLTIVTGFADMLMHDDIPENVRGAVTTINDSARQVADIVKNLLTFARQQKLERMHVNANDVVQAALAMRAHPMETGNVKVNTELDPALPLILADATLLQQVFLNLIINAETAMKSAHGKGTLLIKTEAIDNAIRISFVDDGPGIAEVNLVHLFDPFFSTRGVGQGLGLGLSVCYGIIVGHNGQIYVNSQLDRGSAFTIELPVAAKGKGDGNAVIADKANKSR